MDALALLCNLHADGPRTLERLRREGCAELEALDRMPLADLERCLGAAPSRAQRFLAEARLLRDRLGATLLEREPEQAPEQAPEAIPAPTPVPTPAPAVSTEAVKWVPEATEEAALAPPLAAPEAPAAPAPTASARSTPAQTRPVLDAVLEAWRERDERRAPTPHVPRDEDVGVPPPRDAAAGMPTGSDVLLPRPPERPRTTPLDALEIPGLGSRERIALAGAGVATVEDLAAANAVDLARRAKLPFTRLRHWQFLAARAAPTPPASAAPPPPAEEEGAAGPFAG